MLSSLVSLWGSERFGSKKHPLCTGSDPEGGTVVQLHSLFQTGPCKDLLGTSLKSSKHVIIPTPAFPLGSKAHPFLSPCSLPLLLNPTVLGAGKFQNWSCPFQQGCAGAGLRWEQWQEWHWVVCWVPSPFLVTWEQVWEGRTPLPIAAATVTVPSWAQKGRWKGGGFLHALITLKSPHRLLCHGLSAPVGVGGWRLTAAVQPSLQHR